MDRISYKWTDELKLKQIVEALQKPVGSILVHPVILSMCLFKKLPQLHIQTVALGCRQILWMEASLVSAELLFFPSVMYTELKVKTESRRAYTQEIKLKADGTDSDERTKTYTDAVGRSAKTVDNALLGTPSSTAHFNTIGQLWKQEDPDGVVHLYTYNVKGEREYTILALTSTSQGISYSTLVANLASGTFQNGVDRISKVERTVISGSPEAVCTDNYVWKATDTGTTGSRVSRLKRSPTGN